MKGDVKLGLLLVVVVALALATRFLPSLGELPVDLGALNFEAKPGGEPDPMPELPTLFSDLKAPPADPAPGSDPFALDHSGNEPKPDPDRYARPDRRTEVADDAALTDIFPEGYQPPDREASASAPGTAALLLPERDAPKPGDEEIVTEFLPFIEPVPASTPPAKGLADSEPVAATAGQAEKGSLEMAANAGATANRTAKPVHPYFRRYLERGSYFVRPGDTLEGIALCLYGDRAMAQSLRDANLDQLAGAGIPTAGMTLRLP